MRLVGVIPAAGYATRLPGLVGSKEMISIDGRPVMDYLVARMRFSQPDSIRIVTRAAKADLIEHSRSLGLEVVIAEPASSAKSIAVGLSDLQADDRVLLGFPDTIWEPLEGFDLLLGSLSDQVSLVLGLFSSTTPEALDVVVSDRSGHVIDILVKPPSPPGNVIWGCAAATCKSLAGIDHFEYPGEHFQQIARLGGVGGVWLSETYTDIGSPDGDAGKLRPRSDPV